MQVWPQSQGRISGDSCSSFYRPMAFLSPNQKTTKSN